MVRLPRTRGDGPPRNGQGSHSRRAPPHPRGWTLRAMDGCCGCAGSPAPAGMDPGCAQRLPPDDRLPRTRGDGPNFRAYSHLDIRAPPHPRGWTHAYSNPQGDSDGSPAPAGMDPPPDRRHHRTRRLPRTRGDGPADRTLTIVQPKAPPHPRGWTQAERLQCRGTPGSPAPAGMDPRMFTAENTVGWLPRTRGDGPVAPNTALTAYGAPPHPRGWTRIHINRSKQRSRLPRTRGDGPTSHDCSGGWWQAPPHPRGWTRS